MQQWRLKWYSGLGRIRSRQPARSQSRRPPAGNISPSPPASFFPCLFICQNPLFPLSRFVQLFYVRKRTVNIRAVRTPIHGSACPDLFSSKLQIALHILVTVRSIFCCAPESFPGPKQFFGSLSFPIWTAVLFPLPKWYLIKPAPLSYLFYFLYVYWHLPPLSVKTR